MWHDICSATKTLASNALSFMLRSVKNRQVGAVEAADRLLGYKLFSKSRQLRFADLQRPEKVKRVLKPIHELKNIVENNPDSRDIFHPHWVLDIYSDRPDELETTSLYDLLSWYEKERLLPGKTKPLQLKHLPFWLRRRKKVPYIITHQIVNPNQSEENKELYYYQLLKLFKPWRTEHDLSFPGLTFHEAYMKESPDLPDMVEYHINNIHTNERDQQLDAAIKDRAQQLETAAVEEDEQGAFAGCATDNLQCAMNDLVSAHSAATHKDMLDTTELINDYNRLNSDQRRIVDKVVTAIFNNSEQIRLIVSGQGGTGKSRVIDILHRTVCAKTRSNVLPAVVAAHTGLAAHNINGTTIHRVLRLTAEHGKPPDYNRLNQDQLNTVQGTLEDLKLLIVDEVSMISSLTLLYMHLRLTEIMNNNEYFGGLSIVFFGDFLQLPPVKGNQPFIQVTVHEAKQRTGAIGSVNLWESFQYDELTINMPQSGDQIYASLLADLRTGHISDEQYETLTKRLIISGSRETVEDTCNKYFDLLNTGQSPVILLPRTAMCEEINTAMLQRIGKPVHTLIASDTLDTIVNQKLLPKILKALQMMDTDSSRTAGLEKNIQLCVGARAMLKRNKDVEAGLVNGSVGVVEDFICTTNDDSTTIDAILVKFTNIHDPVIIRRESCSFEVLKGIFTQGNNFL